MTLIRLIRTDLIYLSVLIIIILITKLLHLKCVFKINTIKLSGVGQKREEGESLRMKIFIRNLLESLKGVFDNLLIYTIGNPKKARHSKTLPRNG